MFGPIDRDVVAERLKLALEPTRAVFDGVALALPVGSQFAERDLVSDDVVVGDENVVADRADSYRLPAPSA